MPKLPLEVGCAIRRSFRRQLLLNGLKFQEDKGLFTSLFIIEGSEDELEIIANQINKIINKTAI
jgi:hypothetical protein